MNARTEKMEKLLDELALLVDGDREAIERHADFLAEDDEARDLKHEATELAEWIGRAGADYVPPGDLEARVLAALDARSGGPAREGEPQRFRRSAPEAARTTEPGFLLDLQARAAVPHAEQRRARADAHGEPALGVSGPSERGAPSSFATFEPPPWTAEPPRPRAEDARSAHADMRRTTPGRARVATARVLVGGLAIAAAAGIALVVSSPAILGRGALTGRTEAGKTEAAVAGATTGRVVRIAGSGGSGGTGVEVRAPGGGWTAASLGAPIPAGGSIRTDARTRARIALSDGSLVVLNHSTELRLDASAPRRFEVPQGEVLADVAHLEEGPQAAFAVPTGRVEVLGTKFVLTATPERASIRVTRGSVRVQDSSGTATEVREGEEGVVRASGPPEVAPVMDLARSLGWSELDDGVDESEEASTLPGIGSLRGRRPGEREDRERPLFLSRHDVRVRIVGNIARTEIEEVFRNDSDQTLEGIYRFPLPSDAQISRLALDVDGELVEGSFVARNRARRIWTGVIRNATPPAQRRPTEEFIWVPGPWRDPALLEWQRGGQFELRIYPIPAHGERRVVLAYNQVIPPQAEGRRYVYPLAHARDDSTRVGEFHVDVKVVGARAARPRGYALEASEENGLIHLRFTERDFRPNGDLVIDYEMADGDRELTYWTYSGDAAQPPPARSRDHDEEVVAAQRALAADTRPYVAFALRPRLPTRSGHRPRDYVLVIDSSQSMVGERFQRASRLVASVIAEMDHRDRFTVLACDDRCRCREGHVEAARMRAPTADEVRAVREWLAQIEPGGSTDLLATLRAGASAGRAERQRERDVHVIYIGDGVASVGHRRLGALASETERIARREQVTFTTVGIGTDADGSALAAIARAGGGHYVSFVPGQRVSLAALTVLETTYGAALRDARLELPEGLVDVAPAALPTIRAGQEILVVARMARDEVAGDVVLRGSVGGEPFEQRYPVRLVPSTASGNRFVPALWAARTIEKLELEGRGEDEARIIALSRAYSVLSRHTSLLVLESEAMFRAFGIDRVRDSVQWTGEEPMESGGADGSFAVADADAREAEGEDLSADHGDRAFEAADRIGVGMGGAGALPAPLARRAVSAPAFDELARVEGTAPAPTRPPAGSVVGAQAPRARSVAPPFPGGRLSNALRPPPGRWMRRVYYRVGNIDTDAHPSFREQEQARLAEEALRAKPDSRDRHRAAVRALARVGDLERALEIAEAWFARDRLDPAALVARADLLARMGRRDEALRILSGVVDLRPDDVALHERLAGAFERFGDAERACAHRVSLAEIRSDDPARIAAAIRCERNQHRPELADGLLSAIRDERVRERAARQADEAPATSSPRGELLIEAVWSGGDDLDVALIASDGSRISWMGGRSNVVGRDASAPGRETLGLRAVTVGHYIVEVDRTRLDDRDRVWGQLRIRVLDEVRTIPFRLDPDERRRAVARIVVRRSSRLEPVGTRW